jgi:hypothetical protein
MPRPRLEHTKWTLCLPTRLAKEIEEKLTDPVTGNVLYGGRATLITVLLQRWINEQRSKAPALTLAELQGEDHG